MPIFGLDFGTTTTYLADASGGSPEIVPLNFESAKTSKASDEAKDLADDQDALFSRVSVNEDGSLKIGVKEGTRSLKKTLFRGTNNGLPPTREQENQICEILKKIVELHPEVKTKDSVRLGCPAVWDREARLRLAELAKKAGIGIHNNTLIDEAVAAGLNWIHAHRDKITDNDLTLVFDMGGGTLDVAIIHTTGHEKDTNFWILASEGNTFAGDEIDENLLRILMRKLGTAEKLEEEHFVLSQLEEAKKTFSRYPEETEVSIKLKTSSSESVVMTRVDLSEAFNPIIEKSIETLNNALKYSYLRTLYSKASMIPANQMPRIEELSNEPTFVGNYVDELEENVKIEELENSIKNIVLAGGVSNSSEIISMMQKKFKKAQIFAGASVWESAKPHDASRSIVLGLASLEKTSSLQVGNPDIDIWLTTKNPRKEYLLHKAFDPLPHKSFIRNSSPVMRNTTHFDSLGEDNLESKVVFENLLASEFFDISIRKLGEDLEWSGSSEFKNIPIGKDDPRTILYPDGTFVVFNGRGRRMSVLLDVFIGFANYAPKFEKRMGEELVVVRGEDGLDELVRGPDNRFEPRKPADIIKWHKLFREEISRIFPGVNYLKEYLKALDAIDDSNASWSMFWDANERILGWNFPVNRPSRQSK